MKQPVVGEKHLPQLKQLQKMPDSKRKLQTGFVIANALPSEVTELHIKPLSKW